MPAIIIVACSIIKQHRVQSSLGTCSPSPECSESSIMTMTESILTTSFVTMTSQVASEDFFSDSFLIFAPSEKKKSTRETGNSIQEARSLAVWQFGSLAAQTSGIEILR